MDEMKTKQSPFTKFLNAVIKSQRFIIIITSLLVAIGTTLSAVCRYIFQTDIYGMEDIILIGAFWLYFIGAANGSFEKNHISADFVSSYVKNQKTLGIIKIIAQTVTTLLSILFTVWSYELFVWGIVMKGTTSALKLPLVIPQSAIFLGSILMTFYFIMYLIVDIKKFKNGEAI